jgi:GcrA cell cycle regulator
MEGVTLMEWTHERVEALTRLWAEGYSARQIAEKLGGITRNAVIGKAHRLNLSRGAERGIVPEPAPVEVVREELPIPEPRADYKSWMCRWQSHTPGRFGLYICGKTCQPGRHYCAEHLTMAYVQKKKSAA